MSTTGQVLSRISLRANLAGYSMLSAIFAFSAIWTAAVIPEGIFQKTIGVIWLVFLAMIGILGVFRIASQTITAAYFYERHFLVEIKRRKYKFGYSEIEDVAVSKMSMASIFTALLLRNRVQIRMKTDSMIITIPASPNNRKMKTNLYLWLNQAKHYSPNRDQV